MYICNNMYTHFVTGRIEGPDVSKMVRTSVRFERVQI